MEHIDNFQINPSDLFSSTNVLMSEKSSRKQNKYAVIRLFLLIFVFLLTLIGVKYAFFFLVVYLFFMLVINNRQSTMKEEFKNHKIVGKPNPKTLIAPIIAPRSHDLDIWRKNNSVYHSSTNSATPFDNTNSGYSTVANTRQSCKNTTTPYIKGQPLYDYKTCFDQENLYTHPQSQSPPGHMRKGQSRHIHTSQPGVHHYNEYDEPINANNGRGFQYYKGPVTKEQIGDDLLIIEHGTEVYQPIEHGRDVDESNVYDPRFTGFGDNDRQYFDKRVGQSRYYYDDIDDVRMPNSIERSNIDHIRGHHGNLNEMKDIAHCKHLESQLQHRNDMMQCYMKKGNAVRSQQRQAPIHNMY
jgi:hypothetical protein